MNKDKSGIEEFSDSFSQEEIIHEYKKLLEKYRHLKSASEQDQQRIYELKRSWETASAAEAYLSQELEIVSASQSTEIEKVQQRYQHEIDELKKRSSETVSENSCLEQKVEEYREENEGLRRRIDELESVEPQDVTTGSSVERELQLAKENLELLAKIDECRDKMTSSMMSIADRERQIDILKEQVECLEENMQAKREEVEEKTQLLESSQERVIELSTELAMLKSTPEGTNRKGNSLFAEVDDQRQQMKKMLAAQKKHYLYMKKCYNESEQEIRRLKRENAAMSREMHVCATIFLSADKRYKEKLNERILQLLKQNEDLEKKIMWTQEKLIALSQDKGINWLDSMLAFCRTETEELKEQLRSCRLQKGILEESLQKSQQELAKWRFEALKSRCIIIDRETLLEENNIKFKPIVFTLAETELATAAPRVFTSEPKEANGSNVQRVNMPSENQFTTLKSSNPLAQGLQKGEQTKLSSIKIEEPSLIKASALVNFIVTPRSSRKCNQSSFSLVEANDCSPTFAVKSEKNENFAHTSNQSPIETCPTNSKPPLKVNKYTKTPFKKHFEIHADESEQSQQNENKSFEIYEDTVCKVLPTVKCRNKEDLQRQSPKSNSTDSPTIKLDSFNIYEDTVCRLPTVKISTIKDIAKENICLNDIENQMDFLKTKSHVKSSTSNSSPILVEHNVNTPPPLPQSILVKGRSIFDDLSDTKTVTFSPELTTEIKDESQIEGKLEDMKPTRTKSQVIVKRIVVKSNFNKKE